MNNSYIPTAIIGGNLSNQSIGTGEWTFFSCKTLCTQNELIVWFVNGSVLSSLEDRLFQRSPNTPHSHCNNVSSSDTVTHALSLRFDHQFDIPVNVYCAVLSICDITSNTRHCSPKICYSDVAYLEGKPYNNNNRYTRSVLFYTKLHILYNNSTICHSMHKQSLL